MDNNNQPAPPPLNPPTAAPGKPDIDPNKVAGEMMDDVKKDAAALGGADSSSDSNSNSSLPPLPGQNTPSAGAPPAGGPPAAGAAPPPTTPPPGGATPPPKKSGFKIPKNGVILGALAVFLVGGMAAAMVFLNSGGTLDTRQQASTCSGASDCATTCASGDQFSDPCPANGAFGSCQQWADEACATVNSTPTSVSGGTGGGGGGNSACINPNDPTTFKSLGDACDSACGASACDDTGPLECKTCNTGTNKAGQTVCMDGSNDTVACGGQAGGTGGGGSCASGGQSCDSTACCSGLVCQGAEGNKKCQQQVSDPCPGGGTCTGWYGFKCSSLSPSATSNGVPVCEQNGQRFGDQGSATSYATGGSPANCGQIDQVCVGGTNDGQLCGAFTIYDSGCSTGGTNPPPPPPETHLSCVNESCQAVSGSGPNECATDADCVINQTLTCEGIRTNDQVQKADIKIGTSVSFTCRVNDNSLVQRTRFRYSINGGGYQVLQSDSSTRRSSQPLTITEPGDYVVQCRVCDANNACSRWDRVTVNQ